MQKKYRKRWMLAVCLLAADLFLLQQLLRKGDSFAAAVTTAGIPSEQTMLQSGNIALTFDDGPSPVYTPRLLDGLKQRKVKATFFLTGKNAEANPDIVRRIYEEGHLIGNHTYSHLQLNASNRNAFKEELVKTGSIIRQITGEDVLYVRPPYGSWDRSLEAELNLFPVLWNIDPLDWCTDNAASVVEKVIPKARENAVILLHDEYASSVEAALQIVDLLLEKGYHFVTVEEILLE